MWNVLLFVTLIFLEAYYETNYDSGRKTLSGVVEFLLRAMMALSLFAWMSGVQFSILWRVEESFVFLLLGYLLIRFAVFDIIYNLFGKFTLPVFYIGNVKLFDRLLRQFLQKTGFPESMFLGIVKILCLVLGSNFVGFTSFSRVLIFTLVVAGLLSPLVSLIIKLIRKK